MKKISIILFMFLTMCSGLSGIKYGVKGGFNIAHFSNLTFLSKDMTLLNGNDFYVMDPDFSIGLYTSFELMNTLDFHVELLYSSKSVKFQFSENTSTIFGVDYIEVPFFMKYTLRRRNGVLFPYIYGGLYYSALLDSNSKIINNGKEANHSDDLNAIDDIGLVFGIGTELKLKNNNLIFDL